MIDGSAGGSRSLWRNLAGVKVKHTLAHRINVGRGETFSSATAQNWVPRIFGGGAVKSYLKVFTWGDLFTDL